MYKRGWLYCLENTAYSFCKGMWIRLSTTPYQSTQDKNKPHIHNATFTHCTWKIIYQNIVQSECCHQQVYRVRSVVLHWHAYFIKRTNTISRFLLTYSALSLVLWVRYYSSNWFFLGILFWKKVHVKAYLHNLYSHSTKMGKKATSYITNHITSSLISPRRTKRNTEAGTNSCENQLPKMFA